MSKELWNTIIQLCNQHERPTLDGAHDRALMAQPRWGNFTKSIYGDTTQTSGHYTPCLHFWPGINSCDFLKCPLIRKFNAAMATYIMLRQWTCQGVSCTIHVIQQQVLHPRYDLPPYHFEEMQNIIQLLPCNHSKRPTLDYNMGHQVAQPSWGKVTESFHWDTTQTAGPYNPASISDLR
jgi:hypothetical protein